MARWWLLQSDRPSAAAALRRQRQSRASATHRGLLTFKAVDIDA